MKKRLFGNKTPRGGRRSDKEQPWQETERQ